MLGLRSTTPILFFVAILSNLSPKQKVLIGSLLLGVTLAVGTEQGVYLSAGIICTIGLTALVRWKYRGQNEKVAELNVRVLAWAMLGGWLIYPVFLALLCGPRGVLPALRFAFSELPADQFWFHGVPPNTFAASIFSLRAVGERAVLVIALGAFWWAWTLREVSKGVPGSGVRLLMLSTGLFACASYTGMLSARYYAPLARVLVFCALAGLINRIRLFSLAGRRARYQLAIWAILVIGPGLWGPASAFHKKSLRPAEFAGGRELSGTLFSPDLSRHINIIESVTGPLTPENRGISLWSTYAGIIEASTGVFQPAEDYIIHALGPARRARYVATFERMSPEFVLTMRADKMVWEEWLRNEDWPFYEQLLERYEIAAVTPFSLVWKKLPKPREILPAAITLPVGDGHQPILLPRTLPPDADSNEFPAIFVVDVRYQIDNPLRKAPVLGSVARYFVDIEGSFNHTPMSLSPYYSSMRFPVLLKPGSQARLVPQTRSIVPGPSFTIEAITAQFMSLNPHQKDFLARGPEFWLP
jgi:hypothetical protein